MVALLGFYLLFLPKQQSKMNNIYNINPYISRITTTFNKQTQEVITHFGELNNQQINWKVGDTSWSIAQHLHHLVKVNKAYISIINDYHEDKLEQNTLTQLPLIPYLTGRYAIRLMRDRHLPLKSPKKFEPSKAEIPPMIVHTFAETQNELLNALQMVQTKGQHTKVNILAPYSSKITYSLRDAIVIIRYHADRHITVIKNIKNHPNFPKVQAIKAENNKELTK